MSLFSRGKDRDKKHETGIIIIVLLQIPIILADVFHWECAESRYRALPRTTAPAGYQCPSCATPVFPPPNLVSPVADVLREKLAGVNWARAGLGLPLVTYICFLINIQLRNYHYSLSKCCFVYQNRLV